MLIEELKTLSQVTYMYSMLYAETMLISSFIYDSSNRNTRIERFWRNMREMAGNTWINHFKDMAYYGIIDTSDIVHIECIRYCFLQLIDSELDGVARHWNEHRKCGSSCRETGCALFSTRDIFSSRL